jgi:cardiolipin synthase
MTLANKITILRIITIPVFAILLLQEYNTVAAVLFAFSAITDIVDGAVARGLKQKTVLGSYLDPLADKLLLGAAYVTLAHERLAPMWVFVVVFSRDLLILLGWNVLYILTQNKTLTPRWPGKLTTFSQMAAALFLMLLPESPLRPFFVWPMVLLTAASTVDYVWVGAKKMSELG